MPKFSKIVSSLIKNALREMERVMVEWQNLASRWLGELEVKNLRQSEDEITLLSEALCT